ncbi:hypothetical protein HOG21_02885 [bacterium]|jgi:hypothetical protein|nr:hypothetical protein [bacterium]
MNNSIINIINKLEKDYKCKIIRNKKHNLNDDIDIEITINNFKKIKNFLLDNNFCHHYESSSKSHFYTFLNNNFIHLDIIKNKKYINKFFNVSINNIDILNDNTNSKFLRYILLLRKEKLDFFINNKKYIQDNNLLKSKIIQKLFFKDNLDFNDLINIINRKKLIKYLKINNFFSYKI